MSNWFSIRFINLCAVAGVTLSACAGDVSAASADESAVSEPSQAAETSAAVDKTLAPVPTDAAPAQPAQQDALPEGAQPKPIQEGAQPKPIQEGAQPKPIQAGDAAATSAERPSYNHGTGFYVRDGKLYDAKDREFRVRGVNKVHWDATSSGLQKANANVTRWTIDFKRSAEQNVALLEGALGHSGTIATQNVVIPGNWDGTCKDDPALLAHIVDTWVEQASAWTKLEKYMILNIANEWGPSDSTVWRDSYIAAIAKLRKAGYHATIAVTAGGCGQDPNSILKYGQAVFDSDPEQNVVFDQHIYGAYRDVAGGVAGSYDDQPDLASHFAALAETGLVVMLGEFGPGRDIGPSPTEIDPLRVVELAERHGLGWLAWAWDDNNLPGGMSNDDSFSMSIAGAYESSADLTAFGRTVVEHPTWGLKALAKRASIFD